MNRGSSEQGLWLWNTRTRRREQFTSHAPPRVGLYTCGPTVYRFVHIGNLRTYLMADWLRRTLAELGYHVTHVKNITDVGHMRQEALERGEDKMIAAALAEGKTPAEIAAFYTEAFRRDEAALGILPAHVFPRASAHIPAMITLTERLIARGHAYGAGGNIYFDVTSFPAYGQLSGNALEGLLEGVRVEPDPFKRHPADFTLWKAAEPGRLVHWPSPWGDGFPGWHIECSAMAMQYLGEELDLHTGGVDNIFPHHEDEIAQSEAATGRPFVRYWMHGQHLLADGIKMAKSEANAYTLTDLVDRGFSPAAFRYLCATVHYRARLNFTFRALRAADHGLAHLCRLLAAGDPGHLPDPLPPDDPWAAPYRRRFAGALCDDLHVPGALATLWRLARDSAPAQRRLALALEFDRVLGLGLGDRLALADPRGAEQMAAWQEARAARDYRRADEVLAGLRAGGIHPLRDAAGTLRPAPWAASRGLPAPLSSADDVPSLVDTPDICDVSIALLVHGYADDVRRCLASLMRHAGGYRIEVIAVDNDADDETRAVLTACAASDARIQVVRADHRLGEAEGRNVALRHSRGRVILLLDTGVEATGDLCGPLLSALADPTVGAAGRWGVRTTDLRTFTSSEEVEVDAVEGYCFAFRRAELRWLGSLDRHYRYYRNLDLHTSFQLKHHGLRLVRVPDLPVVLHQHRGWEELSPAERERKSQRNFRRFLATWHHDEHLLLAHQHAGARGGR
ncbi:MAG: hypothetical protein NVSMB65_10300 [Chloroflexota bacterium]